MWNGIKALTGYKTTNLLPSDDAKLPDVLNQLFARFDTQTRGAALLIIQPPKETTLVLEHHQVRATLKKVNASKVAVMC